MENLKEKLAERLSVIAGDTAELEAFVIKVELLKTALDTVQDICQDLLDADIVDVEIHNGGPYCIICGWAEDTPGHGEVYQHVYTP